MNNEIILLPQPALCIYGQDSNKTENYKMKCSNWLRVILLAKKLYLKQQLKQTEPYVNFKIGEHFLMHDQNTNEIFAVNDISKFITDFTENINEFPKNFWIPQDPSRNNRIWKYTLIDVFDPERKEEKISFIISALNYFFISDLLDIVLIYLAADFIVYP